MILSLNSLIRFFQCHVVSTAKDVQVPKLDIERLNDHQLRDLNLHGSAELMRAKNRRWGRAE